MKGITPWCTCFCSNEECEEELFNEEIISGSALDKRLLGEGRKEALARNKKRVKKDMKMIEELEKKKAKKNKLKPKITLSEKENAKWNSIL